MDESDKQKDKKRVNWEVLLSALALVVTIFFSQRSIQVSQNQTKTSLDSTYIQMNKQLQVQREFFEEQKQIDSINLATQLELSSTQLQKQLDQANEQFQKSFDQNQVALDTSRIQFQKEMKINQQQYQATLDEISGKAELARRKAQILDYYKYILLEHIDSHLHSYTSSTMIAGKLVNDEENHFGFDIEENSIESKTLKVILTIAAFDSNDYGDIGTRAAIYNLLGANILLQIDSVESEFKEIKLVLDSVFRTNLIMPTIQYDSLIVERFHDFELIEIFAGRADLVHDLYELNNYLKSISYDRYLNPFLNRVRSNVLRNLDSSEDDETKYQRILDLEKEFSSVLFNHLLGYSKAKTKINDFLSNCGDLEPGNSGD